RDRDQRLHRLLLRAAPSLRGPDQRPGHRPDGLPALSMATDAEANAAVVNRLYESFSRRDGEAMAACYTDDAHFADPVFARLTDDEVGAMWRMLTGRANALR